MKTKSANIPTISVSQCHEQAQICAGTDRFLIISGKPGVGKSAIMVEIAQAMGYRPVVVNLSGAGPQEGAGYGIPNMLEDGKCADMIFSAPELFPLLRRVGDEKVMLILEELPNWDDPVQSLFHGCYAPNGVKRIGTHVLGNNVRVMVNGNRKEDGSRISKILSAPFVNRGAHFILVPTISDWCDWFDRKHARNGVVSFVPAFLMSGICHDGKVNKDGEGDGKVDHFAPPVQAPWDGSPHASPRSWEAVALAEHMFYETMPDAWRVNCNATVGMQSGPAYVQFRRHGDRMPEVREWQAGTRKFELPKDKGEQYALINCALIIAQGQCPPERYGVEIHAGKFNWLADILLQVHPELADWAMGSLVNRGVPMTEHDKSDAILGLV